MQYFREFVNTYFWNCCFFSTLAESVGFEPTFHIPAENTLAGCRFKPLIQLSIIMVEAVRFELTDPFQNR